MAKTKATKPKATKTRKAPAPAKLQAAAEERTPILRQRFVEPPLVRKGNPHVAVRVPEELHRDLTKRAGGKAKLPGFVRELLAKACGKTLASYLDDGGEE
jgi:hypothetical protein